MTSTAFDDQFAVCTPEEEEAFCAIEARQREVRGKSIQRERFEEFVIEWCERYGVDINLEDYSPDANAYENATLDFAWNAFQAACPEGWQCVPAEPTQEMQNYGSVARYHERLDCKGLYKAMPGAAPKPEDV